LTCVYRSDRCRSTGRCHRCWQLFRLPAITIGAIPATWKTLIRGTHRRSSSGVVGYGVDGSSNSRCSWRKPTIMEHTATIRRPSAFVDYTASPTRIAARPQRW